MATPDTKFAERLEGFELLVQTVVSPTTTCQTRIKRRNRIIIELQFDVLVEIHDYTQRFFETRLVDDLAPSGGTLPPLRRISTWLTN